MAHFALVQNGLVTDVVVADQDFINSGAVGDPTKWIQTSYNTQGGEHKLGGTPLRLNYAGIGYTYDSTRDAFYEPKPFPSWIQNETGSWEAPVKKPEGLNWNWDEKSLTWSE